MRLQPVSICVVCMILLIAGCGQTTPTVTPSPTAAPSATPTITLTPTPATPIAVPLRDLAVRAGPGEGYAIVGTVEASEEVTIYNITEDGAWALVSPPGKAGAWLALSALVEVYGNPGDLTALGATRTPPAPLSVRSLSSIDARSGPGILYSVVATLLPDDTFRLNGASPDGSWYAVVLPDGNLGWIPDSLLLEIVGSPGYIRVIDLPSAPPVATETPAPAVLIPQREILVRAGPGSGYNIVRRIEAGTPVPIYAISEDSGWAMISPLGRDGEWVGLSPVVEVSGDLGSVGIWGATPTLIPPVSATPPAAYTVVEIAPRSGPGDDYPALTNLNPDERFFPVIGYSPDGKWYRVLLRDGREGWLPATSLVQITGSLNAITPLDIPTATLTPPIARLLVAVTARSGPGSEYPYSMELAAGQEFILRGISEDGGWYYFSLEGSRGTGWIPASSVVEVTGELSVLSRIPAPPTLIPPTLTLTLPPTWTATFVPSPTPPPTITAADVSADDDPAFGPEDAPILMIVFSDFTCPHCKRFNMEILPQILETYQNQIRVVYRDMPVLGENAVQAALAAECADDQGQFWTYHDLLFEDQQSTGRAHLLDLARQLELDMDEFTACLDDEKHRDEINADTRDAQALGVTGVPTIFVNGERVVGAQPFEIFQQVIDRQLAASNRR